MLCIVKKTNEKYILLATISGDDEYEFYNNKPIYSEDELKKRYNNVSLFNVDDYTDMLVDKSTYDRINWGRFNKILRYELFKKSHLSLINNKFVALGSDVIKYKDVPDKKYSNIKYICVSYDDAKNQVIKVCNKFSMGNVACNNVIKNMLDLFNREGYLNPELLEINRINARAYYTKKQGICLQSVEFIHYCRVIMEKYNYSCNSEQELYGELTKITGLEKDKIELIQI